MSTGRTKGSRGQVLVKKLSDLTTNRRLSLEWLRN